MGRRLVLGWVAASLLVRAAEPNSDLQAPPQFTVETRAVTGGAELLTVYARIPDSATSVNGDVPLLAVLRDTFAGQSAGDNRLRYVWVLTSSEPTLLQRAAAALPFFYWRADAGKNADRTPAPILDLSSAGSHTWGLLAGSLAQAVAFDPNGAILRSSFRSYRNNTRDHRQLQLLEGLAVLSQLENLSGVQSHLSEPELLALQARLTLAAQTFGGFVSDNKLPEAYMKQRIRTTEDRGHNWELLRQHAEANGLYFEPFGLNGQATQALLWIAREDAGSSRVFDGRFLNIADPYRDSRVKNWTGYTGTRPKGDGTTQDLIPLGLYSLDHPRVPLLLVDFRSTHAPRRREMIRHAAVDAVSGVIGYSRWGNWPYFAGSWAWNFIQARHGAADNRMARLKSYSQVRQWLALDPALDPALRTDLLKRLQNLGVNPLEDNIFDEAKFAQRQYDALLNYADDPKGLSARLERDRGAEIVAYEHGYAARAAVGLSHIVTFGLYTHRETDSVLLETRIAGQRRAGKVAKSDHAAP